MSKNMFFFIFILIWIFPPIIKFFNWDSYTFSTVVCVSIFILIYTILTRNISVKKYFADYLMISFVILLFNLITTSFFFNEEYDIARSLISIIFMLTFLFGSYFFANYIRTVGKESMDLFMKRMMYFYFIIIFISFFTGTFITTYSKAIFPYSEPSHMALFFGPILCYNVIAAKSSKKRLFLLLIGLAIAVFVKNLTFLLTIIIIAVFIYNIYVVPIAFIGGLFFYYFSDVEYFLSRIDFSNSNSTNLSTLVYIKGFELIQQSFVVGHGLGVGFQQLGIIQLQTETQADIIRLIGEDLNAKDGGFLASKVISEFGVSGILLVFSYIVILIKSWLNFRKVSSKNISAVQILFYSSFITIFSEFFFRSLGYFTPSIFLFFVAIFLKRAEKRLR